MGNCPNGFREKNQICLLNNPSSCGVAPSFRQNDASDFPLPALMQSVVFACFVEPKELRLWRRLTAFTIFLNCKKPMQAM